MAQNWAGTHKLQVNVRCGQESYKNETLVLNADGTATYDLSVNHGMCGSEQKVKAGTWQEISADEVKVIWANVKADGNHVSGEGEAVGKFGEGETEEVVYTRSQLFGST
eukprot:CAMPEP_0181322732 /NCGR_PEP_ID=MMETSP1101-20121128/19388_1 /TAXON_ID=46948 /ORGANISM="Rhodomonas abbreviata, Strain Caron Lab Isolate" /LENGTH=108 /DNA_ID=CAMNT_0023430671 /DNA_START=33 /DNA_END=359 /DNA_ORIENTATION=-